MTAIVGKLAIGEGHTPIMKQGRRGVDGAGCTSMLTVVTTGALQCVVVRCQKLTVDSVS